MPPLARFDAKLFNHLQKLAVHVLPLADAQLGQKVLLARLAKLAAGGFGFELMDEIPELEPAEEIGVGVEPLSVCQIGLLLPLGGAVAWILHFEGGSDDQHIGET